MIRKGIEKSIAKKIGDLAQLRSINAKLARAEPLLPEEEEFRQKHRTLEGHHPLQPQNIASETIPDFSVWRTVQLGLQRSPTDYHKDIKNSGFKTSLQADKLLALLPLSQEPSTLSLSKVFLTELGFRNDVRFTDICERAVDLGLGLLPPEVGPALRLSYEDQPANEWLTIAMEPYLDSHDPIGELFVLHRHGGDLWLDTDYTGLGKIWSPNDSFVFLAQSSPKIRG